MVYPEDGDVRRWVKPYLRPRSVLVRSITSARLSQGRKHDGFARSMSYGKRGD